MFDNLIWGSRVLRLMKVLLGDDRKVAIIRHSERQSFDNLPYHEWDNTGLTAKGMEAAIEFGRAIGASQNPKCLQILWWGLKRCMLTAEAVSEGAREKGVLVSGPSSIGFQSPIAKRGAYDNALRSGNWDQFITDWLRDESPQVAMAPARQYAKKIYQSLVAEELCSFGTITIIITHDLHVLPLARLFFPSSSRWLDYLDGIVVRVDGSKINIGYGGTIVSIEHDELFAK